MGLYGFGGKEDENMSEGDDFRGGTGGEGFDGKKDASGGAPGGGGLSFCELNDIAKRSLGSGLCGSIGGMDGIELCN